MGENNLGTCGTISGGMIMSKTLENENTIGIPDHSTLDQISKLKN